MSAPFWQLTVDCRDPQRLAAFWAEALGYVPRPPDEPDSAWARHYRARADDSGTFDDRLFDPAGVRPPLWFQQVPEGKPGRKNRLHVDVYPTDRDESLAWPERVAAVEAHLVRLMALGATEIARHRSDDPADLYLFVTLQDPEGNELCVSA